MSDSDDDIDDPEATRISPPLHEAIRNNETDFIEKLFRYKFVKNVNATDSLGFTALHIAVLEKNLKVIKILIKHGAKVNVSSDEEKLLPEISALIDRDDEKRTYYNLTPLHIAALSGSKDIVRKLIKHGANVNNEKNDYRIRPLQCAIESGSVEILSILLKNGGEFGQKNGSAYFKGYMKNFERTFCFAAAYGKVEILKHLIINGSVKKNVYGAALYNASMNGYEESVKILIQNGADVKSFYGDSSPIHMASSLGHPKIVKILIDNGVDIDEIDELTETPLSYAAYEGKFEVAKLLVQNGAEVDKAYNGDYKKTPLYVALMEGHYDIAELLICYGADFNRCDEFYNTPLSNAAFEPNYPLIRTLIESGANTEFRQKIDGLTPFERTMRSNWEMPGEFDTFRNLIYTKHTMSERK